jgi:hypothetical protein
MELDRPDRHHEFCGDLSVPVTGGRELGDSELARGQGVRSAKRCAPRPATRRQQLGPRALRQRFGPALGRKRDRFSQRRPSVAAMVRSP